MISDRVISQARTWLGTPYHHQGCLKGVGVDCIGLVRGVYQELFNVEVPELQNYSADWGDSNGKEDLVEIGRKYLVSTDDIQPGTVVLIRWGKNRVAKHCMIMTGEDRAIHAYNRSPVSEINLNNWWLRRIAFGFNFPEEL